LHKTAILQGGNLRRRLTLDLTILQAYELERMLETRNPATELYTKIGVMVWENLVDFEGPGAGLVSGGPDFD
jgi:hypothetical protein